MPGMRVVVSRDKLGAIVRAIPALEDAVLDIASEEIVDQARAIVPVDTGYLRSTIAREKVDDRKYIVKAEAEYASYVEFGTSRMAAQPYLRPALERTGWKEIFRRALARIGL